MIYGKKHNDFLIIYFDGMIKISFVSSTEEQFYSDYKQSIIKMIEKITEKISNVKIEYKFWNLM